MKTIYILNNKGGVGKTTTTISLAAALSTMGKKILIIDLDGQANMTNSLGLKNIDKTIYNNLKDDENIYTYNNICKNIDIAPASHDLHVVGMELSSEQGREMILKELIDSLDKSKYYGKKKSFKSGLDSLITSTTKSENKGISENKEKFVTFNFILKEEYHKKLKLKSVIQGRSIKDIVNDMVKEYFDKK